MKTILPSSVNPTFTPAGAGAGTLNFTTAVTAYGFNFTRLLAVIDLTTNVIIFAAGASGLGGTWNAGTNILTLATSTSSSSSGDLLEVIWDDPSCPIVLAPPTLNTANSSVLHLVASDGLNLTSVKSSAGILLGVYFGMGALAGNTVYTLKFYDSVSSSVVVGTTPVKLSFVIGGYNGFGGNSNFMPPTGVKFSTGISFAITGTLPDSSTTPITGNNCLLDVHYI